MHYLLVYELSADYLERRAEFRKEHLSLAWEAQARGELVLGGALAEPADYAVLLFRCSDTTVIEQFAAADPYVQHGLVTTYKIRPWTTVVGDEAMAPVRL